MSVIEVEHLSKACGSTVAVAEVTFSVEEGRSSASSPERSRAGRLPGVASAFEYSLEPGEVSCHGIRVALELLVAHTWESAEREDHLRAASVGNDPYRVIDDLTRGQRDVMIEDSVFIPRGEGETDPSHRGVHEPSAIDLFDRTPEPRSPLGQVGRV